MAMAKNSELKPSECELLVYQVNNYILRDFSTPRHSFLNEIREDVERMKRSFHSEDNSAHLTWFSFAGNGNLVVLIREPLRERGDNLFPRCALIRGMHETSNADWRDAKGDVAVDASSPC